MRRLVGRHYHFHLVYCQVKRRLVKFQQFLITKSEFELQTSANSTEMKLYGVPVVK